jgi:hypothetical protein
MATASVSWASVPLGTSFFVAFALRFIYAQPSSIRCPSSASYGNVALGIYAMIHEFPVFILTDSEGVLVIESCDHGTVLPISPP